MKVQTRWAGHYAYNTLDQNVVVGPHPDCDNYVFMNGFSGHGLQQSPAIVGAPEYLTYGEFRALDLRPLRLPAHPRRRALRRASGDLTSSLEGMPLELTPSSSFPQRRPVLVVIADGVGEAPAGR